DAFSFSFAVQRALWAEDRDIADLATPREIAHATLGAEGERGVRDEQPATLIDGWPGNRAAAEGAGILGTPASVAGDQLSWGQDRLDFVARALSRTDERKIAS